MKKGFFSLGLLCFLLIQTAYARNFKRITIPGAKCGSGLPYSVFLHQKNSKKLAVEFMGGGACWSASTCYGRKLKTWLFPMVKLPHYSVFTLENAKLSPVHDHSILYFPYCTGDAFMGDHTAKYKYGLKVRHYGQRNVRLAVEFLAKEGLIDFNKLSDLVIYGMSAGAIGAMAHIQTFDPLVSAGVSKTIIADSPGLHFGKTFWHKFKGPLFNDFQKFLAANGMQIELNRGNVTHLMPQVCRKYSDWNLGLLQSTRDPVMSTVFGEISPAEHEKLVLGKEGIIEALKDVPNCSVWVPRLARHTFLLYPWLTQILVALKNPVAYSFDVVKGLVLPNYVDWDERPEIWWGDEPENYVLESWGL